MQSIKQEDLLNRLPAILSSFGNNKGCSGFQIANLTKDILTLSKHYSKNKKDFPVERTIVRKVAARKRLQEYMKKRELSNYKELIKLLELRR